MNYTLKPGVYVGLRNEYNDDAFSASRFTTNKYIVQFLNDVCCASVVDCFAGDVSRFASPSCRLFVIAPYLTKELSGKALAEDDCVIDPTRDLSHLGGNNHLQFTHGERVKIHQQCTHGEHVKMHARGTCQNTPTMHAWGTCQNGCDNNNKIYFPAVSKYCEWKTTFTYTILLPVIKSLIYAHFLRPSQLEPKSLNIHALIIPT